MTATVEVAFKTTAIVAEGPHWDGKLNKLHWVDILGKSLHLFDPESGKDEKFEMEDTVGCVVPYEKGGSAICTVGKSFCSFDFETKKLETIVKVDVYKKGNRFNDGKCDPNGHFWAGTMGPEPIPTKVVPEKGTVYRLDCNTLKVDPCFREVNISNGLCWSVDEKTFYYIDTTLRRVDAFDYDATSNRVRHRRTLFNIDKSLGWPDGMCIDSDNKLWIAMYNGSKVVQFDPSGEVLQQIDFPVTKVTSCCWGGPNYDILYVTSARAGLSESEIVKQPLAGSVFQVTGLGIKGVPAYTFRG